LTTWRVNLTVHVVEPFELNDVAVQVTEDNASAGISSKVAV
jgi:hypothetical protein